MARRSELDPRPVASLVLWAPSPRHPLVLGGLFPAVSTSEGPRAPGRGGRLLLGMCEDVPFLRVQREPPQSLHRRPCMWASEGLGPGSRGGAGQRRGLRLPPSWFVGGLCGRGSPRPLAPGPHRQTGSGRGRPDPHTPTPSPDLGFLECNIQGVSGPSGLGLWGWARRVRGLSPEPTASRAEDGVGSRQDGVGPGAGGQGGRG